MSTAKAKLEGFLLTNGVRSVWSIGTSDGKTTLEMYTRRGKQFIVQWYEQGSRGFEVFIPASESIKIDETFTALKEYLK